MGKTAAGLLQTCGQAMLVVSSSAPAAVAKYHRLGGLYTAFVPLFCNRGASTDSWWRRSSGLQMAHLSPCPHIMDEAGLFPGSCSMQKAPHCGLVSSQRPHLGCHDGKDFNIWTLSVEGQSRWIEGRGEEGSRIPWFHPKRMGCQGYWQEGESVGWEEKMMSRGRGHGGCPGHKERRRLGAASWPLGALAVHCRQRWSGMHAPESE